MQNIFFLGILSQEFPFNHIDMLFNIKQDLFSLQNNFFFKWYMISI